MYIAFLSSKLWLSRLSAATATPLCPHNPDATCGTKMPQGMSTTHQAATEGWLLLKGISAQLHAHSQWDRISLQVHVHTALGASCGVQHAVPLYGIPSFKEKQNTLVQGTWGRWVGAVNSLSHLPFDSMLSEIMSEASGNDVVYYRKTWHYSFLPFETKKVPC